MMHDVGQSSVSDIGVSIHANSDGSHSWVSGIENRVNDIFND